MSALENPRYHFAEFELEPGERRLLGNGMPIALTPKVFDTLVLLVANAGHVARKDDLMKTLWPRGYVDEATLSNHIWQIRRALGDTAKSTRFIETVPKLGYRFCAPVTVTHAADPQAIPHPVRQRPGVSRTVPPPERDLPPIWRRGRPGAARCAMPRLEWQPRWSRSDSRSRWSPAGTRLAHPFLQIRR